MLGRRCSIGGLEPGLFQEVYIKKFKHEEFTGLIIGCAMRAHSTLGSGFMEVVYQQSLSAEFKKVGLMHSREVEENIYYGQEKVGVR